MLQPTKQQLLDSLHSRTCPSCGNPKREQMTFCAGCYHDLPGHLKSALYRRFGSGYEQAVAVALAELDADEFCMEAAK